MRARLQELAEKRPGGPVAAMWIYAGAVRGLLAIVYVLSIATSSAKLLFPLLTGMMINIIQARGAAGIEACKPIVAVLFAILLGLWAVRVPAKMAQFRVASTAQGTMIAALNRRLLSAPLAWHETRHSGDTASRVGQSSGGVFAFSLGQFGLIESLIAMVGPMIALCILSPPILVGAVIAYAVIATICVSVDLRLRQVWVREADAQRAFGTALIDAFRNIMTVYANRRRDAVSGFIGRRLESVFAATRKNLLITEWKWSAIEVISVSCGLGLMVIYVLQKAHGGAGDSNHVALGNAYMVQAYVQGGMGALLGVVGAITGLLRQRTDFSMSAPLYAITPEPECAESLASRWNVVEVTDLTFAHLKGEGATPALRHLDLRLERGVAYALVGLNGSGKSTLLKILAGLLSPDTGALVVDGARTGFAPLRNSATLVPQHPELLTGTLAENLSPDTSPERIGERLAANPAARALIDQLGVDLACKVQEDGANWSGGQRQRIAVARGLLSASNSSLVLVDEPTSSIDARDERIVVDNLLQAFPEACVVVSLHNLELVSRFEQVIVLRDGQVEDAGPAQAVARRCAYFRDVAAAVAEAGPVAAGVAAGVA